jgi:hypothetical protein
MRWSKYALITAPLKEQRRRDCARRHCRPYRGHGLQRQRFPGPQGWPRPGAADLESADKVLMRLNFP